MSDLYRQLTEEEQKLEFALDQHKEALKDEMQAMAVAIILWVVGFFLTVFSPEDSSVERIGGGLFLCAVVCFLANILLGFRTRKYRRIAGDLLDAYTRKKALPFYQELLEMFADKQGIHLHLSENGTIVVTDRRRKEADNVQTKEN